MPIINLHRGRKDPEALTGPSSEWTQARTRRVLWAEGDEGRKSKREQRKEDLHTRVRFAKYLTLDDFTQVRAVVVKYYEGLVTLEPKRDIDRLLNVRIANGPAEVRTEKALHVLLRNFGHTVQKFPKGTVIAYVTKSRIEILKVDGALGREVAKHLNISTIYALEGDEGHKENEDISTVMNKSEVHTAEEDG